MTQIRSVSSVVPLTESSVVKYCCEEVVEVRSRYACGCSEDKLVLYSVFERDLEVCRHYGAVSTSPI